jgi:hypothetical protein
MRSVSVGRLVCIAVVLCAFVAVPSPAVDDALAPSGELAPSARSFAAPMEKAEPGSSEVDVAAGAPRAAISAARLRAFDAAAHERDKRDAARRLDVASGREVPAEGAGLAPSASITVNFAGLNRQTAANNGFVFFPPDTDLAKSTNRVVEVVNSAIRLFNNTGGVIGTSNLNTFFGASTTNGILFDPKVVYDRNAANKRFYVVALQKKGDNDAVAANDVSRVWLAVSRSADPPSLAAANWCRYNIEGRRDIGTASQNWADYPGLGVGVDALVLSFNQFRFSSPRPFIRSNVKAFRKLVAANNAAACPTIPFFQWDNAVGSVDAFTLQPIVHVTSPSSFAGTANPVYLVSNRATSPSPTSRLWRIRNVAGSPTMQFVSFNQIAGQTTPPDAVQPGTALRLDTGDPRLMDGAGAGNSLSVVHTTGCQFGTGAVESCWTYRRLNVGQSAALAPTVAVAETHVAGFGENSFAFWPGVAMNNTLRAVSTVQFTDASPVTRLSAAAVGKNPGLFWSATFNFAAGGCAQTLSNRAGDYAGAAVDPALTSFWVAGERALSIGGSCQWDTRIARMIFP